MENEPVSLVAAITAAVTLTISLLLFLGVDPELVGALSAAATAWITVAAVWLRSRVTPVSRVALTTKELAELQAAELHKG